MDKKIEIVIKQIAKELEITEFKTRKITENIFNYLKNSMSKFESAEYYIPKFGKFNIIPKRYEKYTEKVKENKLLAKKSKIANNNANSETNNDNLTN